MKASLLLMALGIVWPLLAASSSIVLQVSEHSNFISVSHPSGARYQMRDYLCIRDDGEETACGHVQYVNRRGALVRLDFRNRTPEVGETVDVARLHSSMREVIESPFMTDEEMDDYIAFHRALASNSKEGVLSVDWTPKVEKNNLESSLYVGFNPQNPEVGFEFTLQKHMSISFLLGASLFSSSGMSLSRVMDGTLYGIMLASNYYSNDLFDGFWLQMGMGYYNGDITYKGFSETKNVFSVRALLGWRWLSEDYTWGFGLGGQYFSTDESLKMPYDVEFIAPLAQFQFGWVF